MSNSDSDKSKDELGNWLAQQEADLENYTPYVPLKDRLKSNNLKNPLINNEQEDSNLFSLIDKTIQIKKDEQKMPKKSQLQKDLDQEKSILNALRQSEKQLVSVKDVADGVVYKKPMKTNWKPLPKYTKLSEKQKQLLLQKFQILVEGEDVPPLTLSFEDLRIPRCLIKQLKNQNINKPTTIQMQCLPVALSGRDMIGVAFTGCGKTIAFVLPMIMLALEKEITLELVRGEGPIGLVVCPSRELAKQTYDNINQLTKALSKKDTYPELRTLLCIGGISMGDQNHILSRGIHMVVATPGRLQDMLSKKKFNLDQCKYFCLDEADRMVDMGFEEDVRNILSYFKFQKQTVLFSATMPRKIMDFATSSLVKPVIVNVGRAGAASLNVKQDVILVKDEFKMIQMLQSLQKTPPPVLIFSENKNDVDDIYEYLLLKGVEACSVHGGKPQDERELAINSFKKLNKDVLVATDVASKGLDFPDIKHVINFDMPKEIEDYVHRIGRTGRRGKKGISTTFINQNCSEHILLDLKHLLIEAKQEVPQFIMDLKDSNQSNKNENGNPNGCSFCGGLGHWINNCPKLDNKRNLKINQYTTQNNNSDSRADY